MPEIFVTTFQQSLPQPASAWFQVRGADAAKTLPRQEQTCAKHGKLDGGRLCFIFQHADDEMNGPRNPARLPVAFAGPGPAPSQPRLAGTVAKGPAQKGDRATHFKWSQPRCRGVWHEADSHNARCSLAYARLRSTLRRSASTCCSMESREMSSGNRTSGLLLAMAAMRFSASVRGPGRVAQ